MVSYTCKGGKGGFSPLEITTKHHLVSLAPLTLSYAPYPNIAPLENILSETPPLTHFTGGKHADAMVVGWYRQQWHAGPLIGYHCYIRTSSWTVSMSSLWSSQSS